MKYGVVYPQTEFGSDPAAIREYARAAEDLGYSHVVAYDHILGANPDRPGGWQGTYTFESAFMEPFVLFSYMAGVTTQLGFLTGVVILPQRQTALVAKQAATLDLLCKGKFRLGIGNGWNEVEYIGLNQDFHTRGRRIEEQVDLLRQLWTKPLVNFTGRWHTIPDAGLNPLPIQKPIPIWFGGQSDPVLRRVAVLGDGWLPNLRDPDDARPAFEKILQYMQEAGRPKDSLGVEARMTYGDGNVDSWMKIIDGWESLGAECIGLNTMGSGLKTPAEHIAAIRRFADNILGKV